MIPPLVSTPKVRGVTSNKRTSFTSPFSTPAWIAAPDATTSSGLTPLWGSLPVRDFTSCWTDGIRVEPPTNITWSISENFIPASDNAFSTGSFVLSTKSAVIFSNSDLLNFSSKCWGPASLAVINGKLISVSLVDESSILAFSAPSWTLWIAILSFDKSIPVEDLNFSINQSITLWSQSSPPSLESPDVDFTSNTPSEISNIETSKVPPPKSNTSIFWSSLFSSPYERDAAVGSFIILNTFNPAIWPASFVACLSASLKYAGTVITASVTSSPKYDSASLLSFCNILADISCGV